MSRGFWIATTVIFMGFAAYETWLNFHLRAAHTQAVKACFAPGHYTGKPPVSA